jgi:hypothetical protein
VPFGHHKKRSFLEGKGFKLEAFSNDVYPLLPELWHAVLPSEKRVAMAIVERNGGYTLKFLHELYFEAHVLYRLPGYAKAAAVRLGGALLGLRRASRQPWG